MAVAWGRGRLDEVDVREGVVRLEEGAEDVATEGDEGEDGFCWASVVGEGGDEVEEERFLGGLLMDGGLVRTGIARLDATVADEDEPGAVALGAGTGGDHWVEASAVVATCRGRTGAGGAGG